MRAYEGVFVFPPEATTDGRKAQFKNMDDLMARFGAEITQKVEWGRRPFGYPVHKFTEGHFLIVDYKMDPAKATEFRKALELQEELLKYVITVKDLKAEKAAKAAAAKAALKPQTQPVTPTA